MAEMRAETRYARQLFLHGDGSGAPVRNVARVSELSGVHEQTIRKHLPEWEREAAELLASSSEVGLALVLSEEKLEQHTKDSLFIRNQLDSLKWEIEQLDDLTEKLMGLTEKFCDNPELLTEALQLFNAWVNGAGRKSMLRTQFIAMKKLWDDKVGVDALRDIAVTRQKEIAKGQGKIAVKQMESETGPTTRNVGASGVFARPSDAGKVKALDV